MNSDWVCGAADGRRVAREWMGDVNSRWMMCDEGFVSMLGCRTKDVVISKTDTDFIPLHFFEVFLDGDRQVMRTDEPSLNHYEMVLKEDFTLNGYVMWI